MRDNDPKLFSSSKWLSGGVIWPKPDVKPADKWATAEALANAVMGQAPARDEAGRFAKAAPAAPAKPGGVHGSLPAFLLAPKKLGIFGL